MIDQEGKILEELERQEDALGNSTIGRAVSATLRVSPNGTGVDGQHWRTAFTTIQEALGAASADDEDCTLILIAPHGAGYYDIATAGDPTFSSNVILQGTHRNWAKIMNDDGAATSILKLTGRSSVYDLNFNLGTGNNGLIQTRGGARTRHCQFVGENLTSEAVALWYDTVAGKHFKAFDLDFLGKDKTKMTAMKVDDLCCSELEKIRIHTALAGIHILGGNADDNMFSFCDIGGCATGILIDAGNENHFHEILFHHNTTNVTDIVHDHIWTIIHGEFPITIEPITVPNYPGVVVSAGEDAYGGDTEIRAAGSSTKPFKIVGYRFEPSEEKKFMLRFSADSGASWFDMSLVEAKKNKAQSASEGTDFIFNIGTRISCSAGCEDAGKTIQVWLEIQEI